MNDIGEEELWYLYRQYENLPYNKEREEKIRYAVKRADELNLHEWRFVCRYDLARVLYRCGDEGEMLPLLSEIVSIFEENPMTDYVTPYLYTLYRSLYQWECIPQLPLAERRKVADHFFQACKRYDDYWSAYYEMEYRQFIKEGKMEEAEKNMQKSLAADRRESKYSDRCAACVQYNKVKHAIQKKDWEKAVKEAQPLLRGKLTCEQHPKLTIAVLMVFALDRADWKEAEHYAKLLEHAKSPDYDDHAWKLMRYYAFSELEKGKKIFCKELSYILDIHIQDEREKFFLDSYVFWTQYARKYDTVVLELPKNFPLYQEEGVYQTKALAEWFYEQALCIAKQFDTRNGYPYYQNVIEETIKGMKKMEEWLISVESFPFTK